MSPVVDREQRLQTPVLRPHRNQTDPHPPPEEITCQTRHNVSAQIGCPGVCRRNHAVDRRCHLGLASLATGSPAAVNVVGQPDHDADLVDRRIGLDLFLVPNRVSMWSPKSLTAHSSPAR